MQLKTEEEKKEIIELVASQFINFKDFSEKLNTMVNELSKLFEREATEDIISSVSKNFNSIFLC
jgi:uncharacterized protein YpuA (DUF1002 family)